ncbi:MAG TPA: hypothetical protein PKX06_03400 [Phenylobacterium sp.]|nr:hypothetical protein [Phenylobacterium sp.]
MTVFDGGAQGLNLRYLAAGVASVRAHLRPIRMVVVDADQAAIHLTPIWICELEVEVCAGFRGGMD